MGCCHNNDQYNIIAKEYYDNISNANEVLGSYNTFVDAIINVQNTNSQKYPGTYIIKINKAVFIREDECKVYIISSTFSNGKNNVYRIVYHNSGFTTVTIQ